MKTKIIMVTACFMLFIMLQPAISINYEELNVLLFNGGLADEHPFADGKKMYSTYAFEEPTIIIRSYYLAYEEEPVLLFIIYPEDLISPLEMKVIAEEFNLTERMFTDAIGPLRDEFRIYLLEEVFAEPEQ